MNGRHAHQHEYRYTKRHRRTTEESWAAEVRLLERLLAERAIPIQRYSVLMGRVIRKMAR